MNLGLFADIQSNINRTQVSKGLYKKNIEDRKKFHQLDIEVKRVKVFKEFVDSDDFFNEIVQSK